MIRKYGSEHALQCSDIKSKFQNTMMSKYGGPSASTFHIDNEHWDLWQAFKQNPQLFIQIICLAAISLRYTSYQV